MKKILLLLLPFGLFFFGCEKEKPVPVPVPCNNCTSDTVSMEVLWQVPMSEDTSWRDGERAFIYGERVLFNERDLDKNIDYIHVFDKNTGQRLWKWRPNPLNVTISSVSGMYQKDELVTFTTWHEVYCADMIGLKPKWETSIPEGKGQGSPHISVFGDCVYHEHSESAIRDTFSYLVRTNLKIGGSWDTIFSIVNTDGFTPNLSSVTGYKHPSGDTILFFQDRSYNFRSREGRINLYAYNIKADTLLWKLTDFVPERNSNVIQAPIVYENKLYFLGSKDLYCIDVSTGKIIWNRKVESFDNVIVGSVNISDGKLFFKSVQNSSLYALDPATGAVLWVSNDLGYSTRYITYSNGIVYFASRSPNKIYAVRSSDGKKMAEFTSPNHSKPGKTKGNTTIIFVEADPKTGYLYVNDSYFFMCLKPKI